MTYLSGEEVLVIHARIVDATGGLQGVRDIHRLAALIERPKMSFGGQALYPTVFDKAAAYLESSVKHHPFADGNKRTGVAIAARFLYLNSYRLKTTNKVLEKFAIAVAEKKFDQQQIAARLKKHSQKMPE